MYAVYDSGTKCQQHITGLIRLLQDAFGGAFGSGCKVSRQYSLFKGRTWCGGTDLGIAPLFYGDFRGECFLLKTGNGVTPKLWLDFVATFGSVGRNGRSGMDSVYSGNGGLRKKCRSGAAGGSGGNAGIWDANAEIARFYAGRDFNFAQRRADFKVFTKTKLD